MAVPSAALLLLLLLLLCRLAPGWAGGGAAADLVVGQTAPLTGPEGEYGRRLARGLQLAFAEANAGGGVGGRGPGGARPLTATQLRFKEGSPPQAGWGVGPFCPPEYYNLRRRAVGDPEKISKGNLAGSTGAARKQTGKTNKTVTRDTRALWRPARTPTATNVTLVVLDDAHNVSRAVANARQLLTLHGATLLAGLFEAASLAAVLEMPEVAQRGVPIVGPTQGWPCRG